MLNSKRSSFISCLFWHPLSLRTVFRYNMEGSSCVMKLCLALKHVVDWQWARDNSYPSNHLVDSKDPHHLFISRLLSLSFLNPVDLTVYNSAGMTRLTKRLIISIDIGTSTSAVVVYCVMPGKVVSRSVTVLMASCTTWKSHSLY